MAARRRGQWAKTLRRALLTIGLAVVAVCVVGMHQLSSDHTLATADSGPLHHAGALQAMTAGGPGDPGLGGHPGDHAGDEMVTAITDTTGSLSAASVTGTVIATAATWVTSNSGDEGCASCGSHVMLMASCLLALTMVVASWLLRLPRAHTLPWRPIGLSTIVTTGRFRIRPPLSLVELSLRRT